MTDIRTFRMCDKIELDSTIYEIVGLLTQRRTQAQILGKSDFATLKPTDELYQRLLEAKYDKAR